MAVEEHEATEATFDALVQGAPADLVVVEFHGEGCPNCEVFAAARPRLLEQLAGAPVRLVRVDAYREEGLARRFGLYGIPTFLLFRGGRLLGKMSEYYGERYWLAVVREHLSEQ